MKGYHGLDNASALTQDDKEIKDFVRKPYHKVPKTTNQETNPSEDNNTLASSHMKLPDIYDRVYPESVKNKKGFNQKFYELLEFGLSPEMPLKAKINSKLKQGSQSKLLLSDFMTKGAQKKILSIHKLDCNQNELLDKNEKNFRVEVPTASSFTGVLRKNSLFIRSTQSSQTLPPILPSDLDCLKLGKVKYARGENLKKIDKILDDCNILLKNKKSESKRMQSQVSIRTERRSC